MKAVAITLIRMYQLVLSPWVGQHCRFHPSCSNYAIEAIHTHGSFKGIYLAARRLLRCHPWHEGGFDPVPQAHTCQHRN
jgi:hypothetical protein